MKVAMLVNRDNFDKYASWKNSNWELVHMGNEAPDCEKVIDTKADVLVVDAVMKIGAEIIENMPRLS
jgi:Ni,Fe-hydrogenase maturation factor